jgi:hypothetical protein
VLADLRQSDVPLSLWRDIKSIQRFYLDDERRARLERMGWIRRPVCQLAWLLRAMLLRLSPARRLVTLVSLAMFVLGPTNIPIWVGTWDANLRVWGFVLLFVVLMLELKDELVARDEIAVARDVQLGLLPQHAPEVPGWQIWLYTRPANDVGGDVVDAFALEDGRIALALADVAGKGLGAALLASKLQATVRALAPACDGLDDLAGSVNEIMARDSLPNRFSTMIYVEALTGGGQVDVVNAGHCPPRILRHEGPVEQASPGGLPLGVDGRERYTDVPFALAPGDALVIYSDGLTEARRLAPDRMFGEGGLDELLPQLRGLDAEEVGRRLVEAVDKFMNGERIEDDLSLIVLRREPAGASAPGDHLGAGATAPSRRAAGSPIDDPHAARREHHAG